jgi:hypothetical protein
VLLYQAMLHPIASPGLSCRLYFHRYTDDAADLCDVLSSFGRTKATLHEISGMLGFAGKASGIDGGQVEQLVAEGRIAEVFGGAQISRSSIYQCRGAFPFRHHRAGSLSGADASETICASHSLAEVSARQCSMRPALTLLKFTEFSDIG